MEEFSSVDWFSEHEATWSRVLGNRLHRGRGGKPPRLLFVGVHEGRAMHWAVTNIHPEAIVTVVDDFRYDECVYHKGRPVLIPAVRSTFDRVVVSLGRRATDSKTGRCASTSRDIAIIDDIRKVQCSGKLDAFDLVYVDAMNSKQVMDALVRVFPWVRPGGTIVVTNNVNGRLHDSACPKRGIQGFLDAFVTDIKVLSDGFHLFLERRKQPIRLPYPCRYEIYDGQESFDPPRCKKSSKP
jgi:hypothetical protein